MNAKTTVTLRTGNEMPVMGLGTWQLTYRTAETISAALELGYRLIDTSGDYGTQPGIGEGLDRSNIDRSKVYVVTKVEETDDAYDATAKNLHELGLDQVDLMLIHRPPPSGAGEDLWQGLIRAKNEGLTKDIGVSNYSVQLIDALVQDSGEVPVVNQIEWSPLGYGEQMLRYVHENDIVIQAYSPLTRTQRLDHRAFTEIADNHGKTSAQVLIRWNLQLGTVPIPKANQRAHLEENIDVFDFELTKEEMDRLNSLNERYSSLGSLPY